MVEPTGSEVSAGPSLAGLRYLLIDMDGVLFRGETALPRAAEFLPWLQHKGVSYKLLTNNSTGTAEQNVAKLARMGVEANPGDVFTSAMATALYLRDEGATGQSAYVVGEAGLRAAVEDAGINIVRSHGGAKWVVAGLDRHVTYEVLCEACLAIESGATFVATNADGSLPVEVGEVPGAGALQAAITTTTGVKPVVIGKPEGRMLEVAMEDLGGVRSNTAMLGDRLDTDIEAARRAGVSSIMVLTGVSRREDIVPDGPQPAWVFAGLPELMDAWG